MPKFSEINERQKPINLKSTEKPEQDKPSPPTHTQAHHSQTTGKKERENFQGN